MGGVFHTIALWFDIIQANSISIYKTYVVIITHSSSDTTQRSVPHPAAPVVHVT